MSVSLSQVYPLPARNADLHPLRDPGIHRPGSPLAALQKKPEPAVPEGF